MQTNSIEPPTPQEIAQLILNHSEENKYQQDPVQLLQGIASRELMVVPAWGGEKKFWIVYNSPNGL